MKLPEKRESKQLIFIVIDGQSLSELSDDFLRTKEHLSDLSVVQKTNGTTTGEQSMNLYPLSAQGWDNLNNTIQVITIVNIW